MANDQVPSIPSDKRAAIDAFRKRLADQAAGVASGQRGRLIFGIDCTASRQHCWEMARQIQIEMFEEAGKAGGLDMQLAIYRGSEFEASEWVSDARTLAEKMASIACDSGNTQIENILNHALRETERRRISALVFVGDYLEEDPGALFAVARQLGQRGLPIFVVSGGRQPEGERDIR